MFVCSSGGHLTQLYRLKPWWGQHDRRWVTFDTADATSLLAGETVAWAHYPTTRNIPNALRNLRLAWRLLRSERPDVVVSDGAGVAVPFFVIAKVLGSATVYLEVYDRIDSRDPDGPAVSRRSRICSASSGRSSRRSIPVRSLIGRLL